MTAKRKQPPALGAEASAQREGSHRIDGWAEVLGALLEQHRFYINRNWQYFGAILLIESLVLNAYADLRTVPGLLETVSLVSVGLIGIFYHLINWTDMRIDRNAERLNQFARGELIEPRRGTLEGLIPWMKTGTVLAVVPHLALSLDASLCFAIGILILLTLVVVLSERIVRHARRRELPLYNQHGHQTEPD